MADIDADIFGVRPIYSNLNMVSESGNVALQMLHFHSAVILNQSFLFILYTIIKCIVLSTEFAF